MKLLVGTLFAGENELKECQAAIRNQDYKNYDLMLIENLPELEAHHKLYKSFIDNGDKYDLLVKVDADTVIISDHFFASIVEKFSQNPWLEVMNVGVKDFFTDEIIPAGIQIYRNTVKWNFEKDTLFPDIPILDHDRYLYDKTELAPAAIHCKNPSLLQAFHYGVHRGLKAIQKIHSTSHWKMLEKVWENFLRTGDKRIGLAVLGAELVYVGRFARKDQNYNNPKMASILLKYQDMSAWQIKARVNTLRLINWGLLPSKWRQKVIRIVRGKLGGQWDK